LSRDFFIGILSFVYWFLLMQNLLGFEQISIRRKQHACQVQGRRIKPAISLRIFWGARCFPSGNARVPRCLTSSQLLALPWRRL